MAYEFRIVGVVGLGTIGSGIVEVLARSGIDVIAAEVDEMALDRGRAAVTASMDRAVSRGKLSAPERDALLGRIRSVVGMDGFGDVDLAIEAVPEQMVIKRRVFAELDRVCPDRRFWPPARPRYRSPRSRPQPGARTGWSACTSSSPRR